MQAGMNLYDVKNANNTYTSKISWKCTHCKSKYRRQKNHIKFK